MKSNTKNLKRCDWCGDDPLYQEYHDKHWGRPIFDADMLFEQLCLEGQQAGLSWITILKKQATYRQAYDNFNASKIAKYDDEKVSILLSDAGIVRHRLKIEAIIKNARAFLELENEEGFSTFIWDFVNGKQIQNQWRSLSEVPTETNISVALSKALKKKGFGFVGPTTCYAFMQAVGMVNDHLVDCWCYDEIAN